MLNLKKTIDEVLYIKKCLQLKNKILLVKMHD